MNDLFNFYNKQISHQYPKVTEHCTATPVRNLKLLNAVPAQLQARPVQWPADEAASHRPQQLPEDVGRHNMPVAAKHNGWTCNRSKMGERHTYVRMNRSVMMSNDDVVVLAC